MVGMPEGFPRQAVEIASSLPGLLHLRPQMCLAGTMRALTPPVANWRAPALPGFPAMLLSQVADFSLVVTTKIDYIAGRLAPSSSKETGLRTLPGEVPRLVWGLM